MDNNEKMELITYALEHSDCSSFCTPDGETHVSDMCEVLDFFRTINRAYPGFMSFLE